MARKRRCLTQKKRRPKVKEENADTTLYEVEKILESLVRNRMTIHYVIEWKGFSAKDNSKEPEYRLICDDALLVYAQSKLDPESYIQSIPKTLKELEEAKQKKSFVLEILDPITTVAQLPFTCGLIRFARLDTISNKLNFLKYMISYKQSYMMNALYIPPDDKLRESIDRYEEELDQIQKLFVDYPKIEIVFPTEEDSVFYPPPPLSNLLFEPVSEEMHDRRDEIKCQFFPMSDDIGFNRIYPFVEPSYFETFDRDKNQGKLSMGRTDFSADPRFKVPMKLIHQKIYGWNLHLSEDVEENTPLIMFTGVVRPWSVAQESMDHEGELVAFTSFLEIPGTGMCLDRRELHDFTRYIPQSCRPTCGVRLVKSGGDIPDLVVYSLQAIDSSWCHAVTLDYYKMYREGVDDYFQQNPPPYGKIFALYDRNIDFVQCFCMMIGCCGVMHMTPRGNNKSPPKKKIKLTDDEDGKFRGLNLLDSETMYTIKEGKFVD